MPRIKILLSHTLGVDDASDRMKTLVSRFKSQVGYGINVLRESWVDNTAQFAFSVMGFFVEGTLCVEPSRVRLEGTFPLAALPFKSMVERDIKDSVRALLT